MKKNYLKLTLFTLSSMALITLTSNSNGPGGNRTGAPGASGNCGSCHGNNTDATAQISIEISDAGTVVDTYIPGKTYDIELKASGSSSKIGFQLSAVTNSNIAAGTITNHPSGTQVYNAGNQQIWGHSTPGTGNWKAKWTAPNANTGSIRFYACLVLSNSNGNNGGDYVHLQNITLEEETSNHNTLLDQSKNRFQNPVSSRLVFNNEIQQGWIWNNQGQVIKKLNRGSNFDLDDISSGTYVLQYQNNDGSRTSEIIIKH